MTVRIQNYDSFKFMTAISGSRSWLAIIGAFLLPISACNAPANVAVAPDGDDVAPGEARQRWLSANEQAKSVAGNLSIGLTDDASGQLSLAFSHGVTLWVRPALLPEQDAAVRKLVGETQRKLGAPAAVFPQFYEVVEERVAVSAPHGGLCAGLRTRVVAIAEFQDPQENWILRMASFHVPRQGAILPQSPSLNPSLNPGERPRVDPGKLLDCFAFDFVRPAGP